MSSHSIAANLARVRAGIEQAARAAGRDPAGITLVAVSKTRPAEDVVAALEADQQHFGENYAQEGVVKIHRVRELVPESRPVWHFIGPIQSNKTRDLATHFDWVHTVSREKEARRLGAQCPTGRHLNVCLQINVDNDPNKSGVPIEAAGALLRNCLAYEGLKLRGLMTILHPKTEPEAGYNRLRECFETLAPDAPDCWDTLSMGMSGDYPAAIAAGATLVRVGTAIFGPREPGNRSAGGG